MQIKILRIKSYRSWAIADTVERIRDGIRRYIFTLINPHSRFAFAWASTTRNSARAAHALRSLIALTPMPIRYVLTDNGSEFMKNFESELERHHRSPKMNAHCECFNRTIQEIFVDYHEDLLFTDLNGFNQKMADWLVFYNTERPHQALAPAFSCTILDD